MKRLAFILLFVGVFSILALKDSSASCHMGSYEWVDGWGNTVCKSFDTGENRSIGGSLSQCPAGTFISVDSWGNNVCKSFEGNQRYYDTANGCPAGTYRSIDGWGNAICRSF